MASFLLDCESANFVAAFSLLSDLDDLSGLFDYYKFDKMLEADCFFEAESFPGELLGDCSVFMSKNYQ